MSFLMSLSVCPSFSSSSLSPPPIRKKSTETKTEQGVKEEDKTITRGIYHDGPGPSSQSRGIPSIHFLFFIPVPSSFFFPFFPCSDLLVHVRINARVLSVARRHANRSLHPQRTHDQQLDPWQLQVRHASNRSFKVMRYLSIKQTREAFADTSLVFS